ncbi:hypothetical protein JTE90_019874 [Oedothorax gibbosus]|uniref:Uncharacterized protein n=1 Tax=Oedothorax gibbosus TaxID=931172 RepID=A0AAV6VXR0_9ARAC|nr:hypothetical protein JTE90_019874 [Oedothorax gibbosus]
MVIYAHTPSTESIRMYTTPPTQPEKPNEQHFIHPKTPHKKNKKEQEVRVRGEKNAPVAASAKLTPGANNAAFEKKNKFQNGFRPYHFLFLARLLGGEDRSHVFLWQPLPSANPLLFDSRNARGLDVPSDLKKPTCNEGEEGCPTAAASSSSVGKRREKSRKAWDMHRGRHFHSHLIIYCRYYYHF